MVKKEPGDIHPGYVFWDLACKVSCIENSFTCSKEHIAGADDRT